MPRFFLAADFIAEIPLRLDGQYPLPRLCPLVPELRLLAGFRSLGRKGDNKFVRLGYQLPRQKLTLFLVDKPELKHASRFQVLHQLPVLCGFGFSKILFVSLFRHAT